MYTYIAMVTAVGKHSTTNELYAYRAKDKSHETAQYTIEQHTFPAAKVKTVHWVMQCTDNRCLPDGETVNQIGIKFD